MDDNVLENYAASTISFTSDNPSMSTTLSISGDSAYIAPARLELHSSETNVNPTVTWAYTQPRHITPIEFTFQNTSWKYTFCYMLNMIFAPWLVLWSKLTGRSTGFRARNPHYGRPGIGATPYTYTVPNGISGYSGHSGYSGISGYSGWAPIPPANEPVGDFDE